MSQFEPNPAEQPMLDVSVVTYNSSKWISGFFDSLAQQAYPPGRINLLIRDNGSTDDTVAQCRAAVERHAGRFSDVHISEGENLGFGYGHNRNLERGGAPFFLVTNVDLEFDPGSIWQAIDSALGDDDDVASWEFRQKPYEHPKYYDPVTLETSWSSSACIVFRRAALEAVGGYEERIFMYGEDVELSYRLRDHGYRLRYCPKAVCWHYSYEEANQLKPLQFFGSTLANFYLRLRYGTISDILAGLLLYAALWISAPPLPHRFRRLARNGLKMVANAPYFLFSRKRSGELFPFRRWDYETRREGAFYRLPDAMPGERPLVSIIIRTCPGRSGWLGEAIASVANQTYAPIELVLVEDGGESARGEAERAAAGSCFAAVVYRPLAKVGRCRAGNVGLESARGTLIGFLDDDDLLFADHVETLAGELAAHSECAAAYGLAFEVATEVLSRDPLRYLEHTRVVIHRQPFSRPILWHHNYIPIQTLLFRRERYERHGGFDESLENLEDWNLWTRFSLDADFRLVEKTTSLYRVPAGREETLSRIRALDSYYTKAVAKQRQMSITLSPAEIASYAETLAGNTYAFAITYAQVRALLLRLSFLRPLLRPARLLVSLLRQKRG